MNKAVVLHKTGGSEEALAQWAEVVERFGADDGSNSSRWSRMPRHTGRPAGTVGPIRRSARGLAAGRGPVRERDEPEWVELVASSFMQRFVNLFKLERTEEALATCNRAVDRFAESDVPAVVDTVAKILSTRESCSRNPTETRRQ